MRSRLLFLLLLSTSGCFAQLPQIRQLKPSDTYATAFAWSRDNQLLATAHRDGTVHLWEVNSGRHLAENVEFRKYGLGVDTSGLAISPDSQVIAYAGDDAAVHLWDSATGRSRRILIREQIRGVVFKSDQSVIVVATGGTLYDPKPATQPSRDGDTTHVRIHPARVVTIDTNTGQVLANVAASGMLNTVLSLDGSRFAGTVVQFKPATTWPVEMSDPQWRNAIGIAEVRDTATGRLLLEKSPVLGWWTEFSPDASKLRSGISVWEIKTGKEMLHGDINIGRFMSNRAVFVGRAGQKNKGLLESIPWLEITERDLVTSQARTIGRFLGGDQLRALKMPVEAWSRDRSLVVDEQLRLWRLPR